MQKSEGQLSADCAMQSRPYQMGRVTCHVKILELKGVTFLMRKFNSDGADGSSYQWHDICKSNMIFSKCRGGGDSLVA